VLQIQINSTPAKQWESENEAMMQQDPMDSFQTVTKSTQNPTDEGHK